MLKAYNRPVFQVSFRAHFALSFISVDQLTWTLHTVPSTVPLYYVRRTADKAHQFHNEKRSRQIVLVVWHIILKAVSNSITSYQRYSFENDRHTLRFLSLFPPDALQWMMLIYLLRLPGTRRTVIPSGARTVQKKLVEHWILYENHTGKRVLSRCLSTCIIDALFECNFFIKILFQ